MKRYQKWLLGLIVLFLLLAGCSYLFLPRQWDLAVGRVVRSNASSVFRSIKDTAAWSKWWPRDDFDGGVYRVNGKVYPEVAVEVDWEMRKIAGTLNVLPMGGHDSSLIIWRTHLSAGPGLLSRMREYGRVRQIEQRLNVAMDTLKGFLQKTGNIYGMEIKQSMSTDSVLVVTELKSRSYPSTAAIYERIRAMRRFIAGQGVKEVDPPMLHVVRENDSSYRSMIALPVDGLVHENAVFTSRRFVPWKVISGEVSGGADRAERAMQELQNYILDYQFTIMAIPFQSLVTERDREPDSSRWITRVVVPVP